MRSTDGIQGQGSEWGGVSDISGAILIATVLLPFVLQLAKVAGELLMGLLPAAQQKKLRGIVARVVLAVEQANQQVPGPKKKQVAETLIGAALKREGILVDEQELDILIESAVAMLNQKWVPGVLAQDS